MDGAVLVADEDREVPGGGVDEVPLIRIMDGVDAGRDLAGVDLGGEDVQQLDHLVRREVEPGVGADGGAELAHHGGGPDPRPITSPMTSAVRPAPRVMTSYQSPPTAASVPPGW